MILVFNLFWGFSVSLTTLEGIKHCLFFFFCGCPFRHHIKNGKMSFRSSLSVDNVTQHALYALWYEPELMWCACHKSELWGNDVLTSMVSKLILYDRQCNNDNILFLIIYKNIEFFFCTFHFFLVEVTT